MYDTLSVLINYLKKSKNKNYYIECVQRFKSGYSISLKKILIPFNFHTHTRIYSSNDVKSVRVNLEQLYKDSCAQFPETLSDQRR